MRDKDVWLSCLEAAGVDNWEGYSYAIDLYDEEAEAGNVDESPKKLISAIEELNRFQQDRLLDKQEYVLRTSSMNILEELLEAHGVHDNLKRELANKLYRQLFDVVCDSLDGYRPEGTVLSTPSDDSTVDALSDIVVFALGDLLKLGYDPEKCLMEVSREINSRVGYIVDGKFQKDKSEEAQKNWVKADFTKCRLPNG